MNLEIGGPTSALHPIREASLQMLASKDHCNALMPVELKDLTFASRYSGSQGGERQIRSAAMLLTPCVERRIARSVLSLLIAGLNLAAAEPPIPQRVQTVQIETEPLDRASAAQKMFPKVHTLSVRPGYPGEPRDRSGRPLFTPQISGSPAFDANPGMVGTLRVELSPAVTQDPDRHFIHTIRIPAQAAPQDAIEAPRRPLTLQEP
jgi:hypothetical protein